MKDFYGDLRLALNIAVRFLKSNKGQTTLILIGIAIGVSVQIFIGSLIDGLQKTLVDKTIGSSSHITVVPDGNDKFFEDKDYIIKKLREDDRFSSVSKSLDSSAFLFKDEESYPILLRGVKFNDANKIYKFDDKLIEGRMPKDNLEVLIGKNLVEETGIEVGDKVDIITPEGKNKEIKIVGVYDLKVASLNKSWVMSTLNSSRSIFEKDEELSSIETQVKDVFSADTISKEFKEDLKKENLKAINWKEQNEELLSGLAGQSASSYMIQVFVLLSVLLGISSVLAVSVVQKSKQIGILKAMGIKDKTASLIFLFQGLLLGIIGSVLGTVLGISLTYVFSNFVTNADGTPLVSFYLDYRFIAISVLIAILSATIAALIPARKSSKLNPIEVIKNG
ncbi:ABC transporter permease [Asaccharospora irregularis]|uniref:Lipoprotein-releasing system permease protein n=1 Tax=Asaccharospora irregularis DSM 2635 TaxID=1121321 RepID=A0A1M5JJ89_9FIRM|nr:ABC transporter permease [Asaccharospora irregularis]SHG40617.1 lipoprotein-releasing system permease protein [Asaccharospora irregularis DSM 2635]